MGLRKPAAALVIVLSLLGAACSTGEVSKAKIERTGRTTSSASNSTGIAASAQLDWTVCENKLARAANLECSTLAVPLDPEKPEGDTITLALARQRATGATTDRIGSLVLNPGGPGGSGIEFLAAAALSFPDELKTKFDLVSFDPRGVGESTPVRCLTDKQKESQLEGDLTPSTDAEIDAALDDQKELLKGCEKDPADLITHMSTADVAADLDQIRAALGDDKLTYAGFSYGTSIGAVYATLFPENTRALVLDGSVSPSTTVEQESLTQATSFEQVLTRFESACDASTACSLAPNSAAKIAKVRQDLTKSPVKVNSKTDKRLLGVDQFDYALATGLYDTSLWGVLADAITNVRNGGAATLFSLMDRQTGRNTDGTFDNSSDAQVMVSCADTQERPDLTEAVQSAERIQQAAPIFGSITGWSSISCLNWPKATNPLPTITGDGAPPILVIGTVGDPATPYSWAQEMATALESATLLTYEGSGHTAFMKGGPCVDNAVVNYLVALKVPAAGTTCPEVAASISFDTLAQQIITTMVNSGLSEDVASCIVKGAIDEVGEAEFNKMALGDDAESMTQVIMAKTLACVQKKGPN